MLKLAWKYMRYYKSQTFAIFASIFINSIIAFRDFFFDLQQSEKVIWRTAKLFTETGIIILKRIRNFLIL